MERKDGADCVECRFVSGTGLIGSGGYVIYNATRVPRPQLQKGIMFGISTVLIGLGIARILELPPFGQKYKLKRPN